MVSCAATMRKEEVVDTPQRARLGTAHAAGVIAFTLIELVATFVQRVDLTTDQSTSRVEDRPTYL